MVRRHDDSASPLSVASRPCSGSASPAHRMESGTARPRIGPAAGVAVRLKAGASGREHHNGPGGWHGRPARTRQHRATSVPPPANRQFQGHPPQPRTSTFPHCVYGGVTAHRAGRVTERDILEALPPSRRVRCIHRYEFRATVVLTRSGCKGSAESTCS